MRTLKIVCVFELMSVPEDSPSLAVPVLCSTAMLDVVAFSVRFVRLLNVVVVTVVVIFEVVMVVFGV